MGDLPNRAAGPVHVIMLFMSDDQPDIQPDAHSDAEPDTEPVTEPVTEPGTEPDAGSDGVSDEGLLSEPAPDGAHEPL